MSNEIELNGIKYIPKSEANVKLAQNTEGLDYVIIRANRAGVFAGYLLEDNNESVILVDCRRIWYWEGAASISQLAIDGVSAPDECKFPDAVSKIKIMGVIENLICTEKAMNSIKGVGIWKQ
jgi:hypothetical protein